jgi:hypothetical protein
MTANYKYHEENPNSLANEPVAKETNEEKS